MARTTSNGTYKRGDKKSSKGKKACALGLALLTAAVAFASPDVYDRLFTSETVNPAVTADDSAIALLVKYKGSGTSNSGLVAVAAGGDLTFTQGVAASEAATTEFECPVSGALGGVIDVSDAACNTLGEVADIINASTSWRAVIVDGLRADSSNDTLVTISATSAATAAGLQLKADTDVALTETRLLSPHRTDIRDYLNPNFSLRENIHAGSRAVLLRWTSTNTFGSGTSAMQVIQANSNPRDRTETTSILLSEASGATTVAKTLLDGNDYGILGAKDNRLLIRVNNSAALATVLSYPYGLWFRYPAANEKK